MIALVLNFFRKKYVLYVDNPSTGPYEVRFRWLNQYSENRMLRNHVYLDKLVRVSVLGKETIVHNYPSYYKLRRENTDYEHFD